MDGTRKKFRLTFLIIGLGLLCLPFAGCMGMTAQVIHAIYGNKIPAEFEGLEDRKVAIVCVSDESNYGPVESMDLLSRVVRVMLASNVKGIEIVNPKKIDDWKDKNGFQKPNYYDIGKGTGADSVLAIEVESYSLREGQTLYKGRSTFSVTVFDITDGGTEVFFRGPVEFEFPKTHGRPVTGESERSFEAFYINEYARHIAKYFYAYELHDEYGRDAIINN